MPRDVVLHGALLEGTGTQMDKPLQENARARNWVVARHAVSGQRYRNIDAPSRLRLLL